MNKGTYLGPIAYVGAVVLPPLSFHNMTTDALSHFNFMPCHQAAADTLNRHRKHWDKTFAEKEAEYKMFCELSKERIQENEVCTVSTAALDSLLLMIVQGLYVEFVLVQVALGMCVLFVTAEGL